MLDEPVAGMTAKEREATAALLEKIAKDRSIIIIELDMDFVAKIADQVTAASEKFLRKDRWMRCVRSCCTRSLPWSLITKFGRIANVLYQRFESQLWRKPSNR